MKFKNCQKLILKAQGHIIFGSIFNASDVITNTVWKEDVVTARVPFLLVLPRITLKPFTFKTEDSSSYTKASVAIYEAARHNKNHDI